MGVIKRIINKIKILLKKVIPASSKTTNGRFDAVDKKLKIINKQISETESILKQIKSYGNANELDLFYLMCKANEVQKVHMRTFLPYKNKYQGRDIAVVGSGPTLKYYTPNKDTIHIGVNGVYHRENLVLDFLFMQDFSGEGKDKVFDIEEIKNLTCKKFVGRYIKYKLPNDDFNAPAYIEDYINANTYYIHDYFPGHINYSLPIELEYFPLADNASTIFAAIQFALYTHPKRIYIVGCDCSYLLGQHFDGTIAPPMELKIVYENWKRMKKHISIYYSDIEIISVNPVGLVGFFRDCYTEEYEREQKNNRTCTIINP